MARVKVFYGIKIVTLAVTNIPFQEDQALFQPNDTLPKPMHVTFVSIWLLAPDVIKENTDSPATNWAHAVSTEASVWAWKTETKDIDIITGTWGGGVTRMDFGKIDFIILSGQNTNS